MKFRHSSRLLPHALIVGALALTASPAFGQGCNDLPDHTTLSGELDTIVTAGGNGGLGNDMWATMVDRDGIVCQVAFSGLDRGDQWPGSRVISAQKANTANAFSLPVGAGPDGGGLALSTANLWTAVQPGGSTYVGNPPNNVAPGGSLFGLQHSNPVNTDAAYGPDASQYGEPNDPMVGQFIGGVNVFGGGLALYDDENELLGGIGLSGDTSCTTTSSPGSSGTLSGSTMFRLASAPRATTTSFTTWCSAPQGPTATR